MSTHLLGSTVVMGLVFAGIFYALSTLGVQRSAEVADTDAVRPYASGPGERSGDAGATQRLGAMFVAFTLALGVISVALVGGMGAGEGLGPSLLGAAVGLLGLLVVGVLFGGTYSMARSHGLGQAHGVAAGLLVAGGAGIILVAANQIFAFV
jgi:hypothetical protein